MPEPSHIIRGDALALPLADASVDLVVTSPPYFGLRSYTDAGEHYAGQLGSETTPAEFVDALIAATREMVRVLKPSGSIFVNLGDKYYTNGTRAATQQDGQSMGSTSYGDYTGYLPRSAMGGIKPKSLMGIPWRYALRCIDDLGLILRAEVIWAKPNGLPESVTDRVRRSHEQWFHLVKQPRYFSAVDEIREEHARVWGGSLNGGGYYGSQLKPGAKDANLPHATPNPLGKLPSSVWEINEGPSLVRGVLSAIHANALTIDEGERILTGVAWTGPSGSGARSTNPAHRPSSSSSPAGYGQPGSPLRDTASSGSTARLCSHTAPPTNSQSDPSPTDSSSTTSAESTGASTPTTSSPSPSARTFSADLPPLPPPIPSRPTAATVMSSTTRTPTEHQTAAGCAECACEPRTDASTGGSEPPPTASGPGSVWSIPTQPLTVPPELGVDHFAAFPMEWPRRIIQGWSPAGVCTACGEGRRPVAATEYEHVNFTSNSKTNRGSLLHSGVKRQAPGFVGRAQVTITGYACACPDATAPTRPATVLDPFGGTGTTALVASVMGRIGISVDMSQDYSRLAMWRVNDPGQRAAAAQVEKVDAVSPDQLDLFADLSAP